MSEITDKLRSEAGAVRMNNGSWSDVTSEEGATTADFPATVALMAEAADYIDRLEAALKPFAAWGQRIPSTAPDALVIRSTINDPGGPYGMATAGDFRAARRALTPVAETPNREPAP